jgi:type I restriction enzyme S subunit
MKASQKLVSGSTPSRQRVDVGAFLQLPVILPPLPEQKTIAHILRTVQQAKEATEKVIEATRQLKQSLMSHLFTYGPVPFGQADKVELKETEIGEIPTDWLLKDLSEVADIVYGVQAAVAHLTDKSVGLPIFTNVNISNEGSIDLSTLRYYELPQNKRDKLILRKGDLLFNWRSGSKDHVGKTALFDLNGEFTFSSFILRFRVTDMIINRYLHYYLCYLKSCGYFANYRSQSSVNSVFNASAAAKIPVAFPAFEDQKAIVRMLSKVEDKSKAEEARYNAIDAIFNALLYNLMAGKVRVPVDNDPPIAEAV